MSEQVVTLSAFLLARITEDEAAANERLMEVAPLRGGCRGVGCLRRADQPHAFGCPTRVLAACEAKRRIVELHGDTAPFCDSRADHGMTHREAYDAYPQQREWCDTLRALAVAYADRPGFREEWR